MLHYYFKDFFLINDIFITTKKKFRLHNFGLLLSTVTVFFNPPFWKDVIDPNKAVLAVPPLLFEGEVGGATGGGGGPFGGAGGAGGATGGGGAVGAIGGGGGVEVVVGGPEVDWVGFTLSF